MIQKKIIYAWLRWKCWRINKKKVTHCSGNILHKYLYADQATVLPLLSQAVDERLMVFSSFFTLSKIQIHDFSMQSLLPDLR